MTNKALEPVERVARAHSPHKWQQIDEFRRTAEWYRERIGKVGYRDENAKLHLEYAERRAREMAEDQLDRARAALEAAQPLPDIEKVAERIERLLPAIEADGHLTCSRLVRRLIEAADIEKSDSNRG